MKIAILASLALATAAPLAAADKDPAALFADNSPLDLTLSGPINKIVRGADHSTDGYEASLAANGETLPIQLSARGLSRRNPANCKFPPLLVKFAGKPADISLFHGQGRLKLVTHCRDTDAYERYVLREFAAYRLYNQLTPQSLRVRLARVRYVDGGKPVAERWGFFIEDVDDAARRLGGKELDVATVPYSAIDGADLARYSLFEYMIGNLDFDAAQGPAGTTCCHNSKLIGATATARSGLIPVPYDFDYSGFVNPPYAVPPQGIPVPSVRVRYYRGMCSGNGEAQRAALDFIAARPRLEAELRSIAELDPRDRDDLLKYLAGFYDDVATPEQVQKKLLKTCR